MKELKFDSASLQILLEQTPENFTKNFNQMFYLNGEALKLLMKYLPSEEALRELLKAAKITTSTSRSEIFAALQTQYSEEDAAVLLAQTGHIDWVVSLGKENLLIEQGLFLDEICLCKKSKGIRNCELYNAKHIDILVKNQDWKTLAYYDEADILFHHERYEDMLYGAQKCYELLYHSDHKNVIVKDSNKLRQKACSYFNPYLFLITEKEYEAFASDNLWKQVDYLYKEKRISAQTCFEAFANIAICQEQQGQINADLLRYTVGLMINHKLIYGKTKRSQNALEVWLYHNLMKLCQDSAAKKILKQHFIFSKIRRRIKAKRTAITYGAIYDAVWGWS